MSKKCFKVRRGIFGDKQQARPESEAKKAILRDFPVEWNTQKSSYDKQINIFMWKFIWAWTTLKRRSAFVLLKSGELILVHHSRAVR